MYILFGSPLNRSFRVVWLLEELQLPFRVEPLQPGSPAMLAVNPSGKAPALIDEAHPHQTITDSAAICQYLADVHQWSASAGSIERAQQDAALHGVNDEIDAVLWQHAKHRFVLPEALRVVESLRPACEYELDKAWGNLARLLEKQPFVAGESMSVADIVAGHCAGWAQREGFVLPQDGPVNEYVQRLWERPAYQRAFERRELSR